MSAPLLCASYAGSWTRTWILALAEAGLCAPVANGGLCCAAWQLLCHFARIGRGGPGSNKQSVERSTWASVTHVRPCSMALCSCAQFSHELYDHGNLSPRVSKRTTDSSAPWSGTSPASSLRLSSRCVFTFVQTQIQGVCCDCPRREEVLPCGQCVHRHDTQTSTGLEGGCAHGQGLVKWCPTRRGCIALSTTTQWTGVQVRSVVRHSPP